jgi:hypothetical protein
MFCSAKMTSASLYMYRQMKATKLLAYKVVVPSPATLFWDACSITYLKTHSSMHLKEHNA